MLERPQVILVHEMGLLVAPFAPAELLVEPLPLIHRVVQLGERVGDLPAADDQLEPVDDLRPFVVATRERRNVERVFRDEGRPGDLLLGHLLVDRDQQVSRGRRRRIPDPEARRRLPQERLVGQALLGEPAWRAAACATVRRSQGGVKSTVSPGR